MCFEGDLISSVYLDLGLARFFLLGPSHGSGGAVYIGHRDPQSVYKTIPFLIRIPNWNTTLLAFLARQVLTFGTHASWTLLGPPAHEQ